MLRDEAQLLLQNRDIEDETQPLLQEEGLKRDIQPLAEKKLSIKDFEVVEIDNQRIIDQLAHENAVNDTIIQLNKTRCRDEAKRLPLYFSILWDLVVLGVFIYKLVEYCTSPVQPTPIPTNYSATNQSAMWGGGEDINVMTPPDGSKSVIPKRAEILMVLGIVEGISLFLTILMACGQSPKVKPDTLPDEIKTPLTDLSKQLNLSLDKKHDLGEVVEALQNQRQIFDKNKNIIRNQRAAFFSGEHSSESPVAAFLPTGRDAAKLIFNHAGMWREKPKQENSLKKTCENKFCL